MSQHAEVTPVPTTEITSVYRAAIRVLTWGFRTGAGLLVIGLLVSLVRQEALNSRVDPFDRIFPELINGETSAIIDLAILEMMAVPLLTVLVVALGFFRAGDRRYGILSLVVLGVLGISVTLSLLR